MAKYNLNSIKDILKGAQKDIDDVENEKELETNRIKYLGRKSSLTTMLRSIKDLPQTERKTFGQEANKARKKIEDLIEEKGNKIKGSLLSKKVKSESMDATRPGLKKSLGHINLLTQYRWKAERIFQNMGFDLWEPRILDDDYNHFKALNIPDGHPARDIWDTMWTEDDYIAIAHTSAMQNRIMKSKEPPIRAVVTGDCFRHEATDARHEHSLIQIEGVYVDKGITMRDMIGTLQTFFEEFFEKKLKVKVTNDYFPFVEPGNGMELSCVLCDMKGCRVCKQSGWLEILGCGMIHPYVLKEADIDPEIYSGFAWGLGLERLIMLSGLDIDDIRLFRNGDLRFIRQF